MTKQHKQSFAWSLWGPVILAFIIVTIAWMILIKIAKDHPTETVPLTTAESN